MTTDDRPDRDPVLEPEERFGKRDRLARMLRVVAVLRGHPEGIRPSEIARRTGVATRTVYRDLRALEEEVGVAVWSEDGRWGVVSEEFLPPLKLTLDEAMAVVLSARLMGAAFGLGALVPILPFLLVPIGMALPIAVVATGLVLFGIGVVKSRWTRRSALPSGLEVLALAAVAGIAGYLFGTVLPSLLGVAGIVS